MKLLLKIRYNGQNYCGFQAQPNGVSVQQVLTESISRFFGFPCNITGCSRTDSGVHALAFCATVAPRDPELQKHDWCRIPPGKFHRAINPLLPSDIAVTAAATVDDSFHPRYSVVSKTYEYRITDAPARDPFLIGRTYALPQRISDNGLARMQETASVFLGEHDFTGYMAVGSKITDAVRTVFHVSVTRTAEELIVYRVCADGFLYNMVRIMAGTLVDCALGRKTQQDALAALENRKRSLAGFTAPPEGLYLADVQYDRKILWECL